MKLLLRAVEPADLEAILRWENDSDCWDYSDVVAPLSAKIIKDYIDSYNADPFDAGQLRLIISDETGVTYGMADLFHISAIHAHAAVGIYIDADYRRRGIALRALKMLCNYASLRLGLHNVAAAILPANKASAYLFKAAGFTQAGTLPQWRRTSQGFSDLHIFTIQLRH